MEPSTTGADVPLKKAYIVDREIGVSIKAEEWLDIIDGNALLSLRNLIEIMRS
jgi:hypothetical protein